MGTSVRAYQRRAGQEVKIRMMHELKLARIAAGENNRTPGPTTLARLARNAGVSATPRHRKGSNAAIRSEMLALNAPPILGKRKKKKVNA